MIYAADLFSGAGGASTGLRVACDRLGLPVQLVAVNHWPVAVATHAQNHPSALHFCQPVEAVDPRTAVPGGKLDVLIAAPECTHHSVARGGKPVNDQSRASAWHVLRWLELLKVDRLLLENVPEFLTWGPIGSNGRPLKSKAGQTFRAFVSALESYGYKVEHRILNSADYGEATTRRRLFLQARKGRGRIVWPEPTHSRSGGRSLLRGTAKWRAAREVIDWSIQGESILARKKALAPATMRRIVEGLKRFGGPEIQPFIVSFYSEREGEQPRGRSIDDPLPTIPTENRFGIAEPFVVQLRGTSDQQVNASAQSVDDPLRTITAGGTHQALVEPFLLGQQSGSTPRNVGEPMPTIATDGAISLIEPYLTKYYGAGHGVAPVTQPMPTVTTNDRFALVEPSIEGARLDIRFRMLQPHELAAAMGFPADYQFTGTKGDKVKQIGNAISVRTMAALCQAALSDKASKSAWRVEATA